MKTGFIYYDDTLPGDSTETEDTTIYYDEGVTISEFTDGRDTVYIICDDSTLTSDSMIFKESSPEPPAITITPNGSAGTKTINPGLFGVNVSDMYNQLNEDNVSYDAAVQALSDMKPRTIRYPSGSASKFMNPFGSVYSTSGTTTLINGGYGYDIKEMIPFFDITESTTLNAPPFSEIQDDMDDDICDNCNTWMLEELIPQFTDYYNNWYNQVRFDPANPAYLDTEDRPLYINQFIRMIKTIEENNQVTDPSYKVDVLVCLNIFTQTAEECKTMVKYLRSNGIHNLQITGVEIGNETWADFYNLTLGFSEFGHYWSYITVTDYTDFHLSSVLPADMPGQHNYLSVLNGVGELSFDVNIGLCAENLHGDGYAFIIGGEGDEGPRSTSVWNEDLQDKYTSKINFPPHSGIPPRYAFDAVILHPYYQPVSLDDYGVNSNWKDIPLCMSESYSDGEWLFSSYDSRLQCAFEGIIGIGNMNGNFKTFIKSRYKESYDEQNTTLQFNITGASKKDLWTSEWNFHDIMK